MDLNLVLLAGRLAAPPEALTFESGARCVRYLVTVRSDVPQRRVDVVPVTDWSPEAASPGGEVDAGRTVWVVGTVRRRFWDGEQRRRSRLEVIAHEVEFRDAVAEEGTGRG